MTDKRTIFWDVDTQYDFMEPEGRLYVPGAPDILHNVSRLRALALGRGYPLIASTDWHSMEDAEIDPHPDYEKTYPPHCMAGTPGAERVGFMGHVPIDYIDSESLPATGLKQLAQKRPLHIVLRKQALDVFTNPNTRPLLDTLDPEVILIFGVALDICVKHTLTGLQRTTDARLVLVADAVKGMGTVPDDVLLDEFESEGIIISRLSDLDNRTIQSRTKIEALSHP